MLTDKAFNEPQYVDREYLLGKIDGVLALLSKELLKYKPWWYPSRLYLWWMLIKMRRKIKAGSKS